MDLGSSCNLGGSCNLAAAGEEAGRRSWREELAISGELQHQDLELARPREEGGDLQLCASHPPSSDLGVGDGDLGDGDPGVGDGIWAWAWATGSGLISNILPSEMFFCAGWHNL